MSVIASGLTGGMIGLAISFKGVSKPFWSRTTLAGRKWPLCASEPGANRRRRVGQAAPLRCEAGSGARPDAGNCCQALAPPSGVEMEFVSRLCRLPARRELAGLRAGRPAVRRAHAARTEGGLAAVLTAR